MDMKRGLSQHDLLWEESESMDDFFSMRIRDPESLFSSCPPGDHYILLHTDGKVLHSWPKEYDPDDETIDEEWENLSLSEEERNILKEGVWKEFGYEFA